ncbi:MAG: hypothetical protein OEV30_04010 [Ignavibacteria bacterium]|nr:hypothetical protein [Ignavibacteria bacterium]
MTESKSFRYKLDFYYQSVLLYLVTLILYGGIRGSLVEKRFEYVLDDPLMYVILFFVLISIGSLVLNRIRDRRLVVGDTSITFRNRFEESTIEAKRIEWIYFGREKRVQTAGMFQMVVFKLKDRRRLFRIRIGRYERAKELLAELRTFAAGIPERKTRRWGRRGITDR